MARCVFCQQRLRAISQSVGLPVYDRVYHTPLGRFSIVHISTVGIAPLQKRSALETTRRQLSEDAAFGVGALLVVEQSSLVDRPRRV